MRFPLKVVLDTNVFVSAFLTSGNSRNIVDLAARRKILVFSSSQIEEELGRVLKNKIKYKDDELSQALLTYKEVVHKIVYPKKKLKVITQDETDNRILEAGMEGKVHYIISGDKHLLNLAKYKRVKILNPADFLEFLKD